MKLFLSGMGLVAIGGVLGLPLAQTRAQLPLQPSAPGAPTAVLKQPSYVQSLFNSSPSANPAVPGAAPGMANLTPLGEFRPPPFHEKPDPNKDIAVSPAQGPWMIFIETYIGEEAAALARQMVAELRGTYKLPAYVYNHAAEERRKEHERICDTLKKRHEYFKQNGITVNVPLRVRTVRIEDQYAVVVGNGYRDDSEAKRALDRIRGLPAPDPRKVRLATKFYGEGEAEGALGQFKRGEEVYINPFKRAFVGRNPTTKAERPLEWDKMDRAVLERLNRDEPLTLLKCPRPVTLIIKQLNTPTVIQPKSGTSKFLETLGFGGKGERVDAAAQNAHNLAELLRKMNVEAYVLHTRYSSIVTVGAFDRPDDPALQSMQHFIETRLRPHMQQVDLLAQPLPWNYRAAITGS